MRAWRAAVAFDAAQAAKLLRGRASRCVSWLRSGAALVAAVTLPPFCLAAPLLASSRAAFPVDFGPCGAVSHSNPLEWPRDRLFRLSGLPGVHCLCSMGSSCSVIGGAAVTSLWQTRLDPNGSRRGLELHGARGRSARTHEGTGTGRAFAVVLSRRNGKLSGCVCLVSVLVDKRILNT